MSTGNFNNIDPVNAAKNSVQNALNIGAQREFPRQSFINLNPKDAVEIAEKSLQAEQQEESGKQAAAQAGTGLVGEDGKKTTGADKADKENKDIRDELEKLEEQYKQQYGQDKESPAGPVAPPFIGIDPNDPNGGQFNPFGNMPGFDPNNQNNPYASLGYNPELYQNMMKQQTAMQNQSIQTQMWANQQQTYMQTMNTVMQMMAERQKWWADIFKLFMDVQTHRFQKMEEAMLARQQVVDKIMAAWDQVILGGGGS